MEMLMIAQIIAQNYNRDIFEIQCSIICILIPIEIFFQPLLYYPLKLYFIGKNGLKVYPI
jgi:hypothetical protein